MSSSYYYSSSAPSAPPRQVEVTISSARDLKNVNWRHGSLKPYVVAWVDPPKSKYSTKVDDDGDTSPVWDETLVIPLVAPIDDSTLFLDVVHANAADDTKPLIGSARIPLKEIVDDVGFGERAHRTLQLKRPSGRPQGKIEAKITVREPRYRAPDPYYAPPYGVPPPPPPATSKDYPYSAPPPYGYPYAAPPPPYSAAPPADAGYSYGAAPPAPYGQPPYGEEKKKSKYGMGTGLAVGAVAGVLGGLALAEGVDYVEDKIAEDVAEKVEDDLAYDYGGDEF
ncbi:PREDICTED: protein SRC2 homolog [Nelumbo nucifera]|uniref:Protein SRC2 homolog n=1 Tax=Nelumbo nucifera TaxID=4432 RepID=A0A1U7ZMI7_NELNU|nr:PREDICTED: protein SRC2 homolog [Nelumbo nucifera]